MTIESANLPQFTFVRQKTLEDRFSLTENIKDFGNCLTSMDIRIEISNMIYQFVEKHELHEY